jgi:hypothetical protein
MLKELGEKLEAGMRGAIMLLALLMALSVVALGTYLVVMICWRIGVLCANSIFHSPW